jgi:RNA polymerase sigma-70 factor (ECF subfamily)
VKDFYRKQSGVEKVSLEDSMEVRDDMEWKSVEETQDRLKIIQKHINKLPEKHRIIITLRDIQGKSYSEIAEILNISPGTVDSRLFRARRKLRTMIAPYLSLFRRES